VAGLCGLLVGRVGGSTTIGIVAGDPASMDEPWFENRKRANLAGLLLPEFDL